MAGFGGGIGTGFNSTSVGRIRNSASVPIPTSNLLLWLDANDSSTITESSGSVSQWNDKSGNNNHLTQGSGSLQPTTNIVEINGLNAIDFDGTQYLSRSDALGLTGNPSIEVWLVLSADSNLSTVDTYFYLGESTGAGGQRVGFSGGSDGYSYRFADGNQIFNSTTIGSAQVLIYERALAATYEDGKFYHNGVEQSETSSGNPTNTLNLANDTTIIASSLYSASNTSFADCRIGELLVYNTNNSNSNKNIIGNYFKNKWATGWTNI